MTDVVKEFASVFMSRPIEPEPEVEVEAVDDVETESTTQENIVIDFRDHVYHGNCLDVMREMDAESVDAIVTDPPYGLSKEPDAAEVLRHWLNGDDYVHTGGGFMGRSWDSFVPGPSVWKEAYRVLKPGGHLLAFFGTRTYDLGVMAIRLAGFEIRDEIAWAYGSGFPKSLDVSKAIDKRGGHPELSAEIGKALRAARESRGMTVGECDRRFCGGTTNWSWFEGRPKGQRTPTPQTFSAIAAEWPEVAHLSAMVDEVERHVIGEYEGNILAVAPGQDNDRSATTLNITAPATEAAARWQGWGTALKPAHEPIVVARKPFKGTVASNVQRYGTGALNIDGCRIETDDVISGGLHAGGSHDGWDRPFMHDTDAQARIAERKAANQAKATGLGRWPANIVHDGSDEVLAVLGDQARFFYTAKASKKERNLGLDGDTNEHPTVKPLSLMRYLTRLVTPPNGTVLDPFVGSGTTGMAAIAEGFQFIGIEQDVESVDIARRRIRYAETEGID